MPGPEDYSYENPDGPPQIAHAVPEVSQADSNPAFYPPEQKSEAVLSDEEKQYLAEKEETEAAKGGEDVKTGDGETIITKDEVEAAKSEPEKAADKAAEDEKPADEKPADKRNVPKASNK